MADNRANTKVRPEEKRSALSIAFIWIGGIISAPALMIGALLISGFSLGMTIVITIIGFVVQAALMALNGMQASDTGYGMAVLLGKTFGDIGSRYILSTLISILQFFQAGIQVAVCGGAFCAALASFGISFPLWLGTLIWGIVMVITAVYGFGWMSVLNYVAVPFLVIVCLYATIRSAVGYGFANVIAYQPAQPMGFVAGLAVVIGMLAMGTLTTTNLTRFAKSRKSTILSTAVGIVPAAILMLGMGAIMGMTAGTSDITQLFIKLGLPVIGVMALVLATWTTNTTNFYMMGVTMMRVFGAKEKHRALVTGIAGMIATVLGMFGIINYFAGFMSFLATIFPPVAGIMIADYWIIGRGKPSNWGIVPGVNWIGIVSWAAGALVGFFVKVFSPSFNSIIVGMVVYFVLYAIFRNKVPKAKDPVDFVGTGDE